jgi:hypothetical protein
MGEWPYSSIIFEVATDMRWMISFIPRPFYSSGKSPNAYYIWSRVGVKTGLNSLEINTCLCRESSPSLPACSPSLFRLTYPVSFRSSFIAGKQGKNKYVFVGFEDLSTRAGVREGFQLDGWVSWFISRLIFFRNVGLSLNYMILKSRPNFSTYFM